MLPLDCAVLVAAPPTLYRQGLLTTLLDHWPGLAITLTTDAQALVPLLRRQRFALAVLDSALAGPSLPRLLGQLQLPHTQQPVLVLTPPRLSPGSRQSLLRQGVALLLPHHTSPLEVVATIRPWLTGETGGARSGPPAAPARPVSPPTPFSPRELDVLRLVVADRCNREIAQQLSLSIRTVESHRRALLQKAGARTLVGLAVQAVRAGWVPA
ncbi:response regulator transcription factor [Hymenobacter gummosus]|uniref:Response regulator transcription factor n=1 Tax=Hymenobacter gummosus TaxID=1776032 RepID=A0A431TYS5_9BACT|nr:response regulator transcription factor [Hymenobacter gummosus]RTQ47191.1 response regulator transcription factor [Hymenobacter gummosus]